MGVIIGDEICMADAGFLRGDLRKDKIDEPRECAFSSEEARFKFDGLFLSRLLLATDFDEGEVKSGPVYSLPSALASSCAITYLYISANCSCAMALSRCTVGLNIRSLPGGRIVDEGECVV
jgi:hypothetical protein